MTDFFVACLCDGLRIVSKCVQCYDALNKIMLGCIKPIAEIVVCVPVRAFA